MNNYHSKKITRINSILVLLLFVGCGFSDGIQGEVNSLKSEIRPIQTEDLEAAEVSSHKVFRLYDQPFQQMLETLPEIDGFIHIYDLDFQNFSNNLVGVTDS